MFRSSRSAYGGREGYRHGALERTITTAFGVRELRVPRGHVEILAHDEHTRESQSRIPATDQDASVLQHEAAAVTLLFGLIAFGQIVLRRIDGHAQLAASLAKEWSQVA